MLYHAKIENLKDFGLIKGEIKGNNYDVRVSEGHKRETDESIYLILFCESFSNLKDFKDDTFKPKDFKCIFEIHKGKWTKQTWNKESKKYDSSEEEQSLLDKALCLALAEINTPFKGSINLSDNETMLRYSIEKGVNSFVCELTETEQSLISDEDIKLCMDAIGSSGKNYGNKSYAKKSHLEISKERLEAIKFLLPSVAGKADSLEDVLINLKGLRELVAINDEDDITYLSAIDLIKTFLL